MSRPANAVAEWRIYLWALLVTLVAAAVRIALDPLLAERYPLATIYAAVALVGWWWGVVPAAFAAVAGYAIGDALFLSPRGVGIGGARPDVLQLATYAALCTALIALVHRVYARQRELDAALADQQESRERLHAAHIAARMVEWQWDLGSDAVTLSRSAEYVFGTRWSSVDGAWRLAHPDDAERVQRTIREAIAGGRDYAFVSRMIRPDTGAVQWIETRAVVHRAADGGARSVTGITIDVTDRQSALEALAQAEQRFRVALEGSSIVAWACDAERRYTWVYNPAPGFAPETYVGQPVGGLPSGSTFPEHAAAVDRVWRSGRAERLPVAWEHGGELRHYVANVDPVRDESGAVVGLVGAYVDVTELYRAQREAQEVRTELQTIVDAMASGVCRCSRDLRYLWASRRYLEWIERPGASIVGRPVADVLGPELFAAKRPYIERVLAGEAVQFEQEVPMAHGARRWFHAAYTPTRAPDGSVDGWVAVITDRTERRQIEAALEESEERLRLALEGATIGMWTTDLTTGLTTCTPLNYRLFGLEPESTGPTGRELWSSLIHPDDRAAVHEAWATASAAAVPYRAEYRIVRTDGTTRWIDSRGRVQPGADGRGRRVLGISMDVTERKLAEIELREASRRKDEFLATLAHELRNPLAPIRYATRLFRAAAPPAAIEDAGRMIERQLAHMARLLDDLLDVSRITRGTLGLRREVLDLRGVVETAADNVRPLADRVGHTLVLRMPADPLPVDGDATRLLQVLGNVLDNATKYTDPGGRIEVEARATDAQVIVEVQDDGIGIPSDLLPRVFELFTQADRQGRGATGLGIGLALARQLVALHGGTLEASSEGPGRGSTFVLRLPRAPDRSATVERVVAAGHDGARAATGTRVLIVDDNADAADSLAQLLALAGYDTKVAYDGATAVEIAAIVRPAIVLLDLGLPNVPGHEVARRIRAAPWGSAPLLIAITGWGHEDDRRRSREAGFDEHLTKPVEPGALLDLLARTTRGAPSGGATRPQY